MTAPGPDGRLVGPPPLARETLRLIEKRGNQPRSTPARAGNTSGTRSARTSTPVHPRSRGKHQTTAHHVLGDLGPPPLARETRRQPVPRTPSTRSTPARAGSTRPARPRASSPTVHPRSRGKHATPTGPSRPRPVHPRSRGKHAPGEFVALVSVGPPPLAREALRGSRPPWLSSRSTPARAGSTASGPGRRRASAVHPRSRGKHASASHASWEMTGSPPLAREALVRRADLDRVRRFTPARAGSTPTRTSPRSGPAVHPRSRGKHSVADVADGIARGSPPLAREAPDAEPGQPADRRFTPARAGSTARRNARARRTAVHPRSRGKHSRMWLRSSARFGSPPLAREAPRHRRGGHPRDRFTPARAGSTPPRRHAVPGVAVHPRSRGKHGAEERAGPADGGSPPLAREALADVVAEFGEVRFTPARAGSTAASARRSPARSVHPRSRGKHAAASPRSPRGGGSPPLAREAPRNAPPTPGRQRFTPARAGSTPRARCGRCREPVHPRSRGKHGWSRSAMASACGSPPLAREARPARGAAGQAGRFTPARAGSTPPTTPSPSPCPVHPRSRGKHRTMNRKSWRAAGSPPLAREARPRARAPSLTRRFTPARAGSTRRPAAGTAGSAVHPRSRGKHATGRRAPTARGGSPPLAREARGRRARW